MTGDDFWKVFLSFNLFLLLMATLVSISMFPLLCFLFVCFILVNGNTEKDTSRGCKDSRYSEFLVLWRLWKKFKIGQLWSTHSYAQSQEDCTPSGSDSPCPPPSSASVIPFSKTSNISLFCRRILVLKDAAPSRTSPPAVVRKPSDVGQMFESSRVSVNWQNEWQDSFRSAQAWVDQILTGSRVAPWIKDLLLFVQNTH